ncbi:MAG: hypothetical protein EPO10_28900 [Reyranella sp.]|uniref:hypothetical protein n=1 Tax=Reyranella sp. TaxID=1929291 RepID=UPI001204EFCA|nr:hypothetical protein [Reyranella sp.]TAJ94712.1 MAG: hypothetical protein EPO41_11615 [Reyranella sp.]TBR22018.1 MAG: hypothetical protein EPO10_28900 [Reyranella sp.]
MIKTAAFVLLALLAAVPAQAQLQAPPVSSLRVDPSAPPANAQAAATPLTALSSSEKVRENPGVQYLLMKTVVAKSIGVQKTRALPVEAGGYNLLKYCWTPANVLGDWGESSGPTGEMVVRALESLSWSRDLARAGYPEGPVAEAIGRYEATLVAANFAEAARARAFEGLRAELQGLQMRTPGTSEIVARERCNWQPSSFGLNVATAPPGGRARFIPYVLHQFCLAQQIDPGDGVRCDYWQSAKGDGPMSFAGETVYSVSWPDDPVATTGRFNPDEQRTAGTVTLRQRPPKK